LYLSSGPIPAYHPPVVFGYYPPPRDGRRTQKPTLFCFGQTRWPNECHSPLRVRAVETPPTPRVEPLPPGLTASISSNGPTRRRVPRTQDARPSENRWVPSPSGGGPGDSPRGCPYHVAMTELGRTAHEAPRSTSSRSVSEWMDLHRHPTRAGTGTAIRAPPMGGESGLRAPRVASSRRRLAPAASQAVFEAVSQLLPPHTIRPPPQNVVGSLSASRWVRPSLACPRLHKPDLELAPGAACEVPQVAREIPGPSGLPRRTTPSSASREAKELTVDGPCLTRPLPVQCFCSRLLPAGPSPRGAVLADGLSLDLPFRRLEEQDFAGPGQTFKDAGPAPVGGCASTDVERRRRIRGTDAITRRSEAGADRPTGTGPAVFACNRRALNPRTGAQPHFLTLPLVRLRAWGRR